MNSPRAADLAAVIEEGAPRHWAEAWDNVGLLVGDPGAPVQRVLVALEVTDPVLDEAEACGAQLLVVHHPVIFRPLKALRPDTAAGRRLFRLLRTGIAVYAAHTNLDVAAGGTNDLLAAAVGLNGARVLNPTGSDRLLKLAVFVPRGHEDTVRDALADAGAGVIGNYTHCTFEAPGTGTFKPTQGADPFLGQVGELERADELRLEVILPESRLAACLAAMRAAHPYEEVAHDIYPLVNPGPVRGHGRVGTLAGPMTVAALAQRVKRALGVPFVRIAGDPAAWVERAAVAAGAGADLIGAAAAAGAQVLVTGDTKHHEVQDALDAGLAVIDPGHYASEAPVVPAMAERLRQAAAVRGWPVEIRVAARGADPYTLA